MVCTLQTKAKRNLVTNSDDVDFNVLLTNTPINELRGIAAVANSLIG